MGTGSWKPALFNISKGFELLSHLSTKIIIFKADENEVLWKWTRWGRTEIIFQQSSSIQDKRTSLLISAERTFLGNWLYTCQKTKSVMKTGQIQTQLQKMDSIYITWKIDRKQEVDKIIERNPACISGHGWYLPVPCRFWSSFSGQHWSWKSPKLSLASGAFLLSVQKRRWRKIFLASLYLSVSL